MPTNHASISNGATASGDAAVVFPDQQPIAGQPGIIPVTPQQVLNMLIDDTERTNWTAAGTITGGSPGQLSVDGKQATIDLAGTAPVRIRHIQVSSMLRSGVVATPGLANSSQNRFTALRQFEVWACTTTARRTAGSRRCTRAVPTPSRANPPRPVAPHMILREFDIPNTWATHLRLVAKTSQCTGGPAFQGEQDADDTQPTTDCDASVAVGSSRCSSERRSSRPSATTGASRTARKSGTGAQHDETGPARAGPVSRHDQQPALGRHSRPSRVAPDPWGGERNVA